MNTFKEYLKKTSREANLRPTLDSDTVGKERGDKSIILVGDQICIDSPGSEREAREGYDAPTARTPRQFSDVHFYEESECGREEQS